MFIVVDDDEISNLISGKVIRSAWPESTVMTFTDPVAAMEFIRNDFSENTGGSDKGILLLNLTMPVMSGWEFLDRFEDIDEQVRSRIDVYILTASLDHRDRERSLVNRYVTELLAKPLTVEMVRRIKATMERDLE